MGRVALVIIDAEANANTTAAKNALALALTLTPAGDIIIFFELFERKGVDDALGFVCQSADVIDINPR